MTNYRDLTKTGAAAALQEFLDERGPALERLRERLMAEGQDSASRSHVSSWSSNVPAEPGLIAREA